MTKKSDKATSKFFGDFGNKSSQAAKSIGKGSERFMTAPLKSMEGMVEAATSGPGIVVIVGLGLVGIYVVSRAR